MSSCYPFDVQLAGSSVHLSTWLHAVQLLWQYLGRKAEKCGDLEVGSHHTETQTAGGVFEMHPNPPKGSSADSSKVSPVSVEIFTVSPALRPSKYYQIQYAQG